MAAGDHTGKNGQEDRQHIGRDAEAWLAARGVPREPIRVRLSDRPAGGGAGAPDPAPTGGSATGQVRSPGSQSPDEPGRPRPAHPEPSRASRQVGHHDSGGVDTAGSAPETADGGRRRDEEVTRALGYARRATARQPRSEARIRRGLHRRGFAEAVVEAAISECRSRGIVDDGALARLLVDEGVRKGHAPRRIRRDLVRRGLPDHVIDRALEPASRQDPVVRALAVARKRAAQLRDVDAETAHRRLVGYLARRGYSQAVARKAARQIVLDDPGPPPGPS